MAKDEIIAKIETLNRKLNKVSQIEEHLDKLVKKEDEGIKKIEQEESKIEQSLLRVGNFTIKRSHLLELARGAAGAFLGVGLGQALGGSLNLAKTLPWVNTLGILVFIIILVSVLIYKNDKQQISESKQNPSSYIIKKVLELYLIAVVVQLIGLALFNDFPGWNGLLIKTLVIGSYASMSSAVAFTLI